MKKRAKQLAMLGLAVTLVCGTQATVFASDVEGETQVAVETEVKETAKEEVKAEVEVKEEKAETKEEVKTEVKEEVVTGTEVTETPKVEKVAGTEELVGMGVSVEAEAKTEAPAEETEAETDADTDTVPTPAPQADIEANADTSIEAEADEVKDVQGELTGIDFTTAEGGVVTVTDADFNSGVVAIPYVLHGTPYDGGLDNGVYFDVISSGDFGIDNPQDLDGNGNYEGAFYANKDALVAEGGTKTYSGTFKMMDTEAGGVDDTLDFSVTVKYVADDNGNNGGGTETPDPEQPENPDNGNGDNGNTETPDPEQPENPDNGNGDNGNNGGDTEKPDGNGDNTQKPDGNGDTEKPDGNGDEQKPENPDNGNNGDNTQKPDDTNKPDDTQKPEEQKPNSNNQNTTTGQQVQATTTDTKTAPKTGDPTTALPFMGAGLSSLGIALGAIFKKHR